jgi:hypothetical protein
LGLLFASCTKEDATDNIGVVSTASNVTYFVNGQQGYADPQTDEEWSMFLDRMFALAEEGYVVRFGRTDMFRQACMTKEKVTYTTTDYNDAKLWAFHRTLEGYEVTITYDQQTGKYTCIAIR